jgi:hypothetical protein
MTVVEDLFSGAVSLRNPPLKMYHFLGVVPLKEPRLKMLFLRTVAYATVYENQFSRVVD